MRFNHEHGDVEAHAPNLAEAVAGTKPAGVEA
jgi:hypothetical protein